ETWSSWQRVVQNSSRELYDTHSWLQEAIDFSFFPKLVLPNMKLRVPIILSGPFLEFCVESSQIWHFFSDFLCCSNANKINKHVNTKAFVIPTIFWEKWCII